MTGNNSTPGEKLRAIFLAALMVGSVFALGVSLSGTAAATAANTNVGNAATVGDDITVTVDVGAGETATFENIVDGETKQTVTVTDGGSADEDSVSGQITVTLTAGKTAGGSSTVEVTNEDTGATDSDTYTTDNYLVEVTPNSVTQGSTSTVEGDVFEYPGDLQDDETLDYSLVYEQDATDNTEGASDIVVAESDTNSGEFTVQRTFDEVDEAGAESHLNDYPSDAFDGTDEPAYTFFVDSSDNAGTGVNAPYGDETPSAANNEGSAIVDTRLDVTATPDESPIQYRDSADVSGTVANADGGLGSYAVKLETPTGVTAKTTDTASTGEYTYTSVFNDAGEWSFGTDEGGFIEYETFSVEGQDANLTFSADADNIRNFEQSYSISLEDQSGTALELSDTDGPASPQLEGYINITGPFADGTGSLAAPTGASIINTVDKDGADGEIDHIHVTTDGSGDASFTAYPVGDSVDATLQNDDAGALAEPVDGVENTNDAGDTPESPDYVATESLSVINSQPVNIIGPQVEDPQDTQITAVGDAAPYTDILTDAGPSTVEVLPLADAQAGRLVSGDRLGADSNKDLAGMTAYRASFELRDGDNTEIAPGSSSGDFDYMIIRGAGIDATVYQTGTDTVTVDSRNDNVLDANYDTGSNRLQFLLRPTETENADEEISHEIKVIDEDPVFLNLSAAGLDIDEFQVNGDTAESVPGDTTLDLTSVVEAPYDGDVPVNNGRVRLSQTGYSLDAETDARTANINNGEYEFDNINIEPRGIDDTGDGVADRVSELVFTAYQYNDSDDSNSLDGDEVDRAAVESLDVALNSSLQVEYVPENTSVYSGFQPDGFGGQAFTLTKSVEYEQIAFNLTTETGAPVDLTEGIDGNNVPLNDLADATINGESFVEIVGADQDDAANQVGHTVHFDESASNASAGFYVIDDIETASNYVASQNGGAPQADDVFAFNDNGRALDTFQLQVTTPDASLATNESTTGYFNVDEPNVETDIIGVNASNHPVDHDASDVFTPVDNVSEMTVGIDRWYRVNATLADATGTPINGSDFTNPQLEFTEFVDGAGGATNGFVGEGDYHIIDSLGNANYDNAKNGLLTGSDKTEGLVLNNESGQFQFDIKPTASNADGEFEPQFTTYITNTFGMGGGTGPSTAAQAYFFGEPTGQNPVVEVYDAQGSDLPTNPSDSSDNDVLANDVKNNLRIEAFPADAGDLPLPGGLEFGLPDDEPFAENIVGTTTSNSDDVVTEPFDEGQLGFISVTPTGTGDSILGLDDVNDGSGGNPVVDTNGDEIRFDVLRSNLQVNIDVTDSSVDAGENITVSLSSRSTGDAVGLAGVSLVDPNGNVVQETQTDASGSATFSVNESAIGGTYTIETRPAGFQPASAEVDVTATDSGAPMLPGASGPAQDTDGDGQYEDVNGDGAVDLFDALDFYNSADSDAVQDNAAAFDFDASGDINGLFDALALWNEISA